MERHVVFVNSFDLIFQMSFRLITERSMNLSVVSALVQEPMVLSIFTISALIFLK